MSLRILPVPVQGADAHISIAAAIRYAGRHRLGDVILVTRGGGSMEDLLPFSEEEVVRAIAESPIPVVSAVGHEIDWALSDFAADHRAPTPSAAAEIIAPAFDDARLRIRSAIVSGLNAHLARLRSLRYRLDRYSVAEIRYRFRNFTAPWYQRLDDARTVIEDAMARTIRDRRNRLELTRERIDGASPYRALTRGYAIVREHSTGTIVSRRAAADKVQTFDVQFDDGTVVLRRPTKEEQ